MYTKHPMYLGWVPSMHADCVMNSGKALAGSVHMYPVPLATPPALFTAVTGRRS